MAKKEKQATKVRSARIAKEVTTNVVVFNDIVLNRVRAEKKAVTSAQKDYRKELASNIEDLQRMYEKDYNGTKGSIDYLCNISGCTPSDFFNIDFVKSLYKTYTFDVVGSESGVRTLIAEVRNVTDKTDFGKLSERAENCPYIGVRLDIEGTKYTDNKKPKYWLPVFNFSASNILAHLLTLDAYALGVATYKKAQKAEKAKAKKAAKKAAKAEAKAAEESHAESK